MQKEVILKIENKKIWLSPEVSLPIERTNIPFRHLKFKDHIPIYWGIVQQDFDSTLKRLKVKIVNYSDTDIGTFKEQYPKEINFIEFEKFDWIPFERNLSIYRKSAFLDQLINGDKSPFLVDNPSYLDYQPSKITENNFVPKEWNEKQKIEVPSLFTIESQQPFQRVIEEQFKIGFHEFEISTGCVKFLRPVKGVEGILEFIIVNDSLLAEFDNIKFWFSKKLKVKKIKVEAIITLLDDKVIGIKATSKEIDSITPELIEGIKTQRTLAITKATRSENIKNALFTCEDCFLLDAKSGMENVFNQTEKQIFELLINNTEVRNRKELIYLSEELHSVNHKIRFTSYPHFGFVFITEGALHNHFVWELLDSNATYVWTFDKEVTEIEQQYLRVEKIINTILECGRDGYKRAYKLKTQDSDLLFNAISHKLKSSESVNGFLDWKSNLMTLIT